MRLALLLALALLAASPAAAHAGIVEPADAEELANALADAEEEQDVCYGWQITNNFSATQDYGNSRTGPGEPLPAGMCERYVVLDGSITYTCEACEGSDTADVSIVSNVPNAPTAGDLQRLGYSADALVGDEDDTTLINMVNALPLLVAERGIAPFLPVETPQSVPASDTPTDKPGSDFLRAAGPGLLVFGFLTLCAPLFWFYKRGQEAQRRATR